MPPKLKNTYQEPLLEDRKDRHSSSDLRSSDDDSDNPKPKTLSTVTVSLGTHLSDLAQDSNNIVMPKGEETSSCMKTTSKYLQILFALDALQIAWLYLTPSQDCAPDPDCNPVLSKMVSDRLAFYILFIQGGFTVATVDMFLTLDAIPAFCKFLDDQPTLSAKIKKLAGVLLFTGIPATQMWLVAKGTGAPLWIQATTPISVIPGAFYSALGMFSRDLPYWKSKISEWSCGSSPSEVDTSADQDFMKRIESKLATLIERENRVNYLGVSTHYPITDYAQDPIQFLHQMGYVPRQESPYVPWARDASKGLGALWGFSLGLLYVLNAHHVLSQSFDVKPKDVGANLGLWVASTVLTSSLLYFFTRFISEGLGEVVDIFTQTKGSQWSLMHQLYPKSAVALLLFAVGMSLFSYAAVYSLSEANQIGLYPMLSCLGAIMFIHYRSVSQVGMQLTERFKLDDRGKFLLKTVDAVEALRWMSLDARLQRAADLVAIPQLDIVDLEALSQDKPSGCLSGCCSALFSRKNSNEGGRNNSSDVNRPNSFWNAGTALLGDDVDSSETKSNGGKESRCLIL